MNNIFDNNVLTLVFTTLIDMAQKEKGCEFAYQCIKNCNATSSKWRKVIVNNLRQHIQLPNTNSALSTTSAKTIPNPGSKNWCKFNLRDITFGSKKLEYLIEFNTSYSYIFEMGRTKVSPAFEFDIKKNHTDWCPWCCIVHHSSSKYKKHHLKRCWPSNRK
jgi:hypothetical protein